VHAEVNAILNCVVLPLTGGTIYATQFPCPRCVQSIIQVGIRRVIYLEQKPHQVASIAAANKMLQDAGLQVHSLAELETESPTWSAKLEQFIRDSRQPGAADPPPGDI
jgi:dCMP deaminase